MIVSIDPALEGKDLFRFLKTNKAVLIAQKKFEVKRGDAISYSRMLLTEKGDAVKANEPFGLDDANTIQVLSVINTTNWLDSHKDVHIPGLWKKSLSENRGLYLLEEHKMSFRGIITDSVKGYTQVMDWRALGLDIDGKTEAIVFDSAIKRDRNPYMFGEYKSGHVKNHSVGMRYVKIDLAINDPDDIDFAPEYDVWAKYYPQIANKEDANDTGYFWAVTEAKVIEGSAVPIGSNIITPTLGVKDTEGQPPMSTVEQPSFSSMIKNFKLS